MKLTNVALVLSGLLAITACGGGSGDKSGVPAGTVPENTSQVDPTANASAISYNDIAVHDPSVIKGDDGYYVFGSHLAAAKSTDLMSWQYISVLSANDQVDESPLFNTYSSEIAEGIAWTDGYKGSWAPDVIKAPNGKYWFYYDHCAQTEADGGCWNRSYLGVAESDSISGPYVNKGIFLRSGYRNADEFTAHPLDNDQTTYDPSIDPNVIDPTAFFDKDGKLWLVYGSYSGGIYVLAMDNATGLPIAGQGYGKHVAGGGFAAIEGSWITYSPETGYYYMFNSIAGFDAAGGYNIRVSRSQNPDGPYVDAAGNDMLLAKNNTDTLSKYGVKLMGGFNFVSELGDTSASWGYLSPGHNSVYHDEAAKKYFLVTHTRFPNRGEEHSVRVHELWLNHDGWFVASPQRYAPINGSNIVDANDLIGDYRLINHEKDSNTSGHDSVYVSLTDSRKITGEVTGRYVLSDTDASRITIYLDGINEAFEGVIAWQWDDAAQRLTPTFSAVNSAGISIWGSQLESKTNAQVLTAVADAIGLPEVAKNSSITLPERGTRAAVISWATSNNNIIKADGTVLRPASDVGDQTVTLTATISEGGSSITKTFDILVPALKPFNRVATFNFEGNLSDSEGNFADGQVTGDRIYKTTEGAVTYPAGHDGNAVNLDGTSGVLLPEGLISNYEYTVSFWIKPTAITGFSPAFFAENNEQLDANNIPYSDTWVSFLPQSWDGNTMLWGRVPQWFDGITGMKIPEGSWTHMAFSVKQGLATVYINGAQKFSGATVGDLFSSSNSKFALGVNYWDLPFNGEIDDLKFYEASLSATEVKALDIDNASAADMAAMAADVLDLGDISALKDNITLPLTGPFASGISWTSSNPAVISISSNDGIVTRPVRGQADAQVTLTAQVSLAGQTVTKEFVATVKSLTPPAPVAVFNFEDDLSEASGHFDAGTAVGNKIGVAGGSLSYAAGKVGQALVLDGDSGVILPDNLITDHSYSISLWLNLAAGTQYSPAFFGWATDSSWISLVPRGPGDAQNTMLWSGTAWFDGTTGVKIPTATWTHLVMVVESGKLSTYVNGELTNSLNNFPDVFGAAAARHFALGVNYWDAAYNGEIDQLKIYDEAITQEDVTELYNETAAQ